MSNPVPASAARAKRPSPAPIDARLPDGLCARLLDLMPHGIAYCRILRDGTDAHDVACLYANPALASHTGLGPLSGKRLSDVIPTFREADPELFAAFCRAAGGGQAERFETFVRSLGAWFSLSLSFVSTDHFAVTVEVVTERKEAEEQLRLQALVLDQVQDHVTITDLNGIVTYVNRTEANALKRPAEGRIGCHVSDYGESPDADASQQEIVDATLAQGAWHGKVVNFLPDGSHLFLDLRTTLVRDDHGQPVAMVGIGTDITARLRAEEALRASEERYRTAFLASLDSVNINRLSDGLYLDVNPAFLEVTGYTREEVIGRTSVELDIWVDPEDRQHLVGVLRQHLACRGFETRFRKKNGELMWGQMSAAVVDLDGVPAILSLTRDITERKRNEEALRESEARYQLALKATNDVIWDWDVRQDAQTWNAAGEQIFGWSNIVRHPQPAGWWLERVHPDDLARVSAGFHRCLDDPAAAFWRDEYRLRCADGHYAQVLDRGYVQRDEGGTAVRMVGALVDITERKLAEAELDAYRRGLEALVAQRTAQLSAAKEAAESANVAKSAFLANVSHEIRTPLTVIAGMASLMRRAGLAPEQAARLEKIDAAGQHLLEVIDAILDLSRIEGGKFTLEEAPINVADIVADVASGIAGSARARGVALLTEFGPVPSLLRGDPKGIRQALLNYATNAVKFTPAGSITLRVLSDADLGHEVLLRFEVQDTGVGIRPEVLPRLFSPFEQADNSRARSYAGAGLGLVLTKHLARLMGGEAGVVSRPDEGSTFWFTARLKKAAQSK